MLCTLIATFELSEPIGWVVVSLGIEIQDNENGDEPSQLIKYLKTHFLQLRILTMHQNGRDSHIRQIKILGPRLSQSCGGYTVDDFKSERMCEMAVIR